MKAAISLTKYLATTFNIEIAQLFYVSFDVIARRAFEIMVAQSDRNLQSK